jgi:hypothetical protein
MSLASVAADAGVVRLADRAATIATRVVTRCHRLRRGVRSLSGLGIGNPFMCGDGPDERDIVSGRLI